MGLIVRSLRERFDRWTSWPSRAEPYADAAALPCRAEKGNYFLRGFNYLFIMQTVTGGVFPGGRMRKVFHRAGNSGPITRAGGTRRCFWGCRRGSGGDARRLDRLLDSRVYHALAVGRTPARNGPSLTFGWRAAGLGFQWYPHDSTGMVPHADHGAGTGNGIPPGRGECACSVKRGKKIDLTGGDFVLTENATSRS